MSEQEFDEMVSSLLDSIDDLQYFKNRNSIKEWYNKYRDILDRVKDNDKIH